MNEFLFKNINLSEYTKTKVKYLWVLRCLYQVGFVFAWTIIISIFLEYWGVDKLFELLLLEGVAVIFGAVIAYFGFLRYKLTEFMLMLISGNVIMLFVTFMFFSNWDAFLLGLVLSKGFFFSQLYTAIVRKTESFFSPKEAQTAIPVIDSAITIGTVFGAIMFLPLLEVLGIRLLVVVWIGILLLIGIYLERSEKFFPELEQKATPKPPSPKSILRSIDNLPFLKILTCIVFFQAIAMSLIDFEFLQTIDHHASESFISDEEKHHIGSSLQGNLLHDIGNEIKVSSEKVIEVAHTADKKLFANQTIAHDLGLWTLALGVISLFVQWFVVPRMLKGIGVINTMLLYMGGLIAVGLGLLHLGVLFVSVARGFQHGAHSVFDSGYHISFYSMKESKREGIRYFLEAFVKPFGYIVAAGLIYLIGTHHAIFSGMALSILALLMIILLVLMKQYFSKTSLISFQTEKESIHEKIHSLEVLGQKGHKESVVALAEELQDKSHPFIIREKIIEAITKHKDQRVVPGYLRILRDKTEDLEVKILVLESLKQIYKGKKNNQKSTFTEYNLKQTLADFYQEHEGHPRKLCIINMFSTLSSEEVVPFFVSILKRGDEEEISIALRSSGEVFDDPEIGFYIDKYLYSSSPRLQGHALIALWRYENYRPRFNEIFDKLLSSSKREDVIAGVYSAGEVKHKTSIKKILKLLRSSDLEIVLQASVALMKMSQEEGLWAFLKIVSEEDPETVKRGLSMIKRKVPLSYYRKIQGYIHQDITRQKAPNSKEAHHYNLLCKFSDRYDLVVIS